MNSNKEVNVNLSLGEAGSDSITFITLQESRLTTGEKTRVLGTIIAPDAAVTLAKNSRFKGTHLGEGDPGATRRGVPAARRIDGSADAH